MTMDMVEENYVSTFHSLTPALLTGSAATGGVTSTTCIMRSLTDLSSMMTLISLLSYIFGSLKLMLTHGTENSSTYTSPLHIQCFSTYGGLTASNSLLDQVKISSEH